MTGTTFKPVIKVSAYEILRPECKIYTFLKQRYGLESLELGFNDLKLDYEVKDF